MDKLDELVDKVFCIIIIWCILYNICLEVNDGINDEDGFFGVFFLGYDINADVVRLGNIIKDILYCSFNNMNCFIFILFIFCF